MGDTALVRWLHVSNYANNHALMLEEVKVSLTSVYQSAKKRAAALAQSQQVAQSLSVGLLVSSKRLALPQPTKTKEAKCGNLNGNGGGGKRKRKRAGGKRKPTREDIPNQMTMR